MIEPIALLSCKCRRIALAVLTAFFSLIVSISSPVAAGSGIQAADDISYVLFAAGSQSRTMSGSTEDLSHAKALRVGREGLLYVRRGGAAYIIRDAATLRRAELIFEPQKAVGARQVELGSRQAALGRRQAALGAEQARLGRQQAGASPHRVEELGRQQNALGRQQNVLGQQQNALGREQNALGREQNRLEPLADAKFRALLAEAIQRGMAQRVH